MSKRIGILGGISAESTLRYYDSIIKNYFARKQNYYYPEVLIYSLDFQRYTDIENFGNKDDLANFLIEGIEVLQSAGVDFALIAANSPHAVFDAVQSCARIPMLSILEVVAKRAADLKLQRVLLLGIKATMQSDFYPTVCAKYGIEVCVPLQVDQDEIDEIIFAELTRGIFKETTKQRLLQIIDRYPSDGAILGCTELPLILQAADYRKPLLDTVLIHALAALDYALLD
jgi:aspartate racemase